MAGPQPAKGSQVVWGTREVGTSGLLQFATLRKTVGAQQSPGQATDVTTVPQDACVCSQWGSWDLTLIPPEDTDSTGHAGAWGGCFWGQKAS